MCGGMRRDSRVRPNCVRCSVRWQRVKGKQVQVLHELVTVNREYDACVENTATVKRNNFLVTEIGKFAKQISEVNPRSGFTSVNLRSKFTSREGGITQ